MKYDFIAFRDIRIKANNGTYREYIFKNKYTKIEKKSSFTIIINSFLYTRLHWFKGKPANKMVVYSRRIIVIENAAEKWIFSTGSIEL